MPSLPPAAADILGKKSYRRIGNRGGIRGKTIESPVDFRRQEIRNVGAPRMRLALQAEKTTEYRKIRRPTRAASVSAAANNASKCVGVTATCI